MRHGGRQNVEWKTPESLDWNHVAIEVLMDIREELHILNRVLACPNFVAIPQKLDAIRKNTAATRAKKKTA